MTFVERFRDLVARLRARGIEPRRVADGLAKLDASLQRVTGATA